MLSSLKDDPSSTISVRKVSPHLLWHYSENTLATHNVELYSKQCVMLIKDDPLPSNT